MVSYFVPLGVWYVDHHESTITHENAKQLPDIRRTITVKASIERVWAAVATSEGLAAWFMPNDLEPRVGHTFHIDAGHWGSSPCEVTVVEPPRRLAFRWDKDWTITIELTELQGSTEVTLIHSGWGAEGETRFGEPHTVVRERMSNGWVGLLNSLKKQLEG